MDCLYKGSFPRTDIDTCNFKANSAGAVLDNTFFSTLATTLYVSGG